MASELRPTAHLTPSASAPIVPLRPTLVVASFKGGVWKTSISVAIAERLALAGAKVLLITNDTQEDARTRLGIKADAPQVARVTRGSGTITILGAQGSVAIELLYRSGPARILGADAAIDMVVVDTPPALQSGHLPGVIMVTPIDGTDAAKNVVTMLPSTPENTDVILVKIHRSTPKEWAHNVKAIESASKRSVRYLGAPLPKATPVFAAHDDSRSVWTLPRRGCTLEFLQGIDILAEILWTKAFPKTPWPPLPPLKADIYIDGWENDNDS